MKLWEVIKALEENPNKKFTSDGGYGEVVLEYVCGFRFTGIQKTKNGAFLSDERDWKEFKQPVSWQEAIEAWISEKNISCTYVGSNRKYQYGILDDINGLGITREELKHGTWYIED